MTGFLLICALLCVLPVALLVSSPRLLLRLCWLALALPLLFGGYALLNAASEVKFLLFGAAVLVSIPVLLLLLFERGLIRWAFFVGLLLPTMVYQTTAINFFSQEWYTGTSRGMEVSLIHLTAILLLVVFFVLQRRISWLPDWGSRLYLLYFLLCLPSLFQADDIMMSWFELWKMMMGYLVFLAVYAYLEYSRGDFETIVLGAALLILVNLGFVVYQHIIGVYQVRGFFPHRNSLAMFLAMVGILFLARFLNSGPKQTFSREKQGRWLDFFIFCVAGFCVFRTYSRGAAACFPVGVLFTIFSSIAFAFSPRKTAVLAFLAVVGAVGMVYLGPRLVERFETAPEASRSTRIELAQTAWNIIQDRPLTGAGLNNWHFKMFEPYTYNVTEDKVGIVETVYLLVAAECGLPCFLVMLVWLGYYLWLCIRLLWRLRNSSLFFLPAGMLGGLVAIYMQSVLEWVLKQAVNYIWLMIIFAVLSYLNTHSGELLRRERETEAEAGDADNNASEEADAELSDSPGATSPAIQSAILHENA